MRDAPIAREWQAAKFLTSHQTMLAHLRSQAPEPAARAAAIRLLLTGMGYSETWRPENMQEVADTVLADHAADLAAADLYVLSPQMCDVVAAAAQTLTTEDLTLLTEQDLPSPSGQLVLPHPLLVRAINGSLGDDCAYQWHSPVQAPTPDAEGRWHQRPSVRVTLWHDTHGPVRPDSFLDFAGRARAEGHPLPPLLLDGIRCVRFETELTDEQRRTQAEFGATARRLGERSRDANAELGFDENRVDENRVDEQRVVGEYTPGGEIDDPDDSFTARFLYAFWRLCEQRIAVTEPAETGHAAHVTAERAGVSPDVRVVQLRAPDPSTDEDTGPGAGERWRHRWVVRMHKVRQWYPTEQRHKVIYRGPYIKGPDDKPLLGGEVARGLIK